MIISRKEFDDAKRELRVAQATLDYRVSELDARIVDSQKRVNLLDDALFKARSAIGSLERVILDARKYKPGDWVDFTSTVWDYATGEDVTRSDRGVIQNVSNLEFYCVMNVSGKVIQVTDSEITGTFEIPVKK